MRNKKLLLLVLMCLFLLGCNKKDLAIKEEPINNSKEVSQSELNNSILDGNSINVRLNSDNVTNLEIRNSTIIKKYKESIDFYRLFSYENNLELIFVEPLTDRISRFEEGGKSNLSSLLNELYLNGAESINYFTDEDGLNIDLSISTHRDELTYNEIIYKASIENISKDFKFEDSKLFEFRSSIIEDNNLDFNKLNTYIKDSTSGELNPNEVFFNKINNNNYEIIRIENGNCYYKLVYDPKL